MPIDFATGFECRATAQLTGGFGESSNSGSMGPGIILTTSPRSGLRCWNDGDTFGSNWYKRGLTNRATRVVAAAIQPSTNASFTSKALLGVLDANDYGSLGPVGQVSIRVNVDGTLSAFRGSSGTWWGNATTLLGTSTNFLVTANAYHFFELVVTVNNSTGSVTLYVDGNPTPWLNLTGIDTQATANAHSNGIGIQGWRVDDLYTADARLSFPDQKILGLNVETGNGALTGSTPSTGTDRGAMVDETTPDDDTTYNAFDSGEEDSYTTPTLGSTSTIRYFIMWQRWRKTDYGPVGVRGGVRIGGTNYYGTERFVGSATYENLVGYSAEVSPATAVAFTEAEINGMELVADRNT